MAIELLINHAGVIQFPVVEEGANLMWERRGSPGRLQFTVVNDGKLNFAEGDPVKLTVDGTPLFYGFVFTKRRDKERTIEVTAYDQIRYLKNKDTVVEENIKASELLQRIAGDFRLQLGEVEDTGFVIEQIDEVNQPLLDMLQNAMAETTRHTGKQYVLYDEVGKLCLRDTESLRIDLLINTAAAENYSYTSSIDDQTYNKINLAYEDEKSGKRQRFIVQDGEHINRWGVLQYFKEIKSDKNAAAMAEVMLKMYNQKTRRLTIKNALGDIRVRGGSLVGLSLNLGDIVANQYMLVDKVTHSFKGDEHLMDLTLIAEGVGGDFVA